MDFVEIYNVCTRKAIIKAAKRISNSDKICHSYCDFYFGVTFLEHSVVVRSHFTRACSIIMFFAYSVFKSLL